MEKKKAMSNSLKSLILILGIFHACINGNTIFFYWYYAISFAYAFPAFQRTQAKGNSPFPLQWPCMFQNVCSDSGGISLSLEIIFQTRSAYSQAKHKPKKLGKQKTNRVTYISTLCFYCFH